MPFCQAEEELPAHLQSLGTPPDMGICLVFDGTAGTPVGVDAAVPVDSLSGGKNAVYHFYDGGSVFKVSAEGSAMGSPFHPVMQKLP